MYLETICLEQQWKMNLDDINNYVPSILNPRAVLKKCDLSLTQFSIVSRSSLSLRKDGPRGAPITRTANQGNNNKANKENCVNLRNSSESFTTAKCMSPKAIPQKPVESRDDLSIDSLGISAIKDLQTDDNDFEFPTANEFELPSNGKDKPDNVSLRSLSSATELVRNVDSRSDSTLILDELQHVSVSFGVNLCDSIDVRTNDSVLKRVLVTHNKKDAIVQCFITEGSNVGTESELDENMNESPSSSPLKRSAVAVNLEIKKKRMSHVTDDNNKVLILNTNAIKKISHVIVQPPNYNIVKGRIQDKFKHKKSQLKNGICDGLKQKPIDTFFPKCSSVLKPIKVSEVRSLRSLVGDGVDVVARDEEVMSKNSGVADVTRSERVRKSPQRLVRRENDTNASGRGTPRLDINSSSVSPQERNRSGSSQSTRRNVESIHFSLPPKSVSSKKSSAKNIPHHKIVAGTHFAVDAFSYGDIPSVRHYFLTHFHSDHYAGLKKSFSKLLFCSKITADLCTSRLGVAPKCIHVLNLDETINIDGVEVTALEANHCPGAVMLAFTLPNGKTMLHTGDFRASPVMESYPVFWNRDIHTIYLDTTYCNPRYDFPTQEQSLEMALYILRQKKLALESSGKKFSSVLVVCGTYTIGKEKFFLGMSRRLGCAVWACPEKQRVLQALDTRAGPRAPPHACQLHVVPMRDLTHEKLRSYLDSLKGAFSEVVAFKPSGWENGKTASEERDLVTIHGIPYSEHSSFSELIRFVKFLQPKQVVPTVDIAGGVRAVQKYFPCPLVYKDELSCQSKLTDFFSIQGHHPQPAGT